MSVLAPLQPGTPADAASSTAGISSVSLADRLWPALPTDRWVSWLVTLAITAVGAVLRWPNLGAPHAFSFDETYYAKDAFSLLTFGYEHNFVDKANATILASNGNPATLHSVFSDGGSFIVHPPVGKWVIAVGEHFFGVTPFGWRFSVCVLGTLAVLMTVRIARRLTRSTLLGGMAGLLIALDGQAIVHSRTGLLDPVLMFFVLAAFGALLLDRDMIRKRLSTTVLGHGDDRVALRMLGAGLGPNLGLRPWRWVAALCLGLACGVKWSGVWFVIAVIILTLCWDISTRRLLGVSSPWLATLARSAPWVLLWFVIAVAIVYVGTWSGWLLTSGGYDRQWAGGNPSTGLAKLVPDALRSLWQYHREILHFHDTLTTPHTYQSNPWSWLVQARPTSYYYQSPINGQPGCATAMCSSEVVALGNPIIWWAALLALGHQAWRGIFRRDWRSAALFTLFFAGWFPWLFTQYRTTFTFYSVAYLPFVVMALAMTLGSILGPVTASPNRRAVGASAVGAVLIAVVLSAWFFYPIWTAEVIPYAQWQMRMWFPTWV